MPDIKCPNCNYEFPLEEALNDEMKEAIEKKIGPGIKIIGWTH